MATVRELLNQVWVTFRRSGIADDLTIIEYIAKLLIDEYCSDRDLISRDDLSHLDYSLIQQSIQTGQIKQPPVGDLPISPPAALNIDVQSVKAYLREASAQVGSVAKLFDRNILFRLPTMLPGGRYPTPRHIAQLMYQLADIKAEHNLADFACGSAGLLVQRNQEDSTELGQTFGIDISPIPHPAFDEDPRRVIARQLREAAKSAG